MVSTFESVDEIGKCEHSNGSCWGSTLPWCCMLYYVFCVSTTEALGLVNVTKGNTKSSQGLRKLGNRNVTSAKANLKTVRLT